VHKKGGHFENANDDGLPEESTLKRVDFSLTGYKFERHRFDFPPVS